MITYALLMSVSAFECRDCERHVFHIYHILLGSGTYLKLTKCDTMSLQ